MRGLRNLQSKDLSHGNGTTNSGEDERFISHDDQGYTGRAQRTVPQEPGQARVDRSKIENDLNSPSHLHT